MPTAEDISGLASLRTPTSAREVTTIRRIKVRKLRMLKGALLSAGILAGLLGSVALSPSAYAQSYWNGVAPSTPGPGTAYGSDYGYGAGPAASGSSPNWG